MTKPLTIDVPDDLMARLEKLAEDREIDVDAFVLLALTHAAESAPPIKAPMTMADVWARIYPAYKPVFDRLAE